ncbi:PREDICTED: dentin sialophosphoprotein-like [Trachymyrmex septentrionalis]|uniref:dentin sialophosphoprotein-like n=1 Tax=Trachymyrmex septentrionalis TaxID=34720 RepID=UPI00084F0227|nr:PREDICTED: dentin sialophosphoprotein-like [Trachymyrmex septentrionalis]
MTSTKKILLLLLPLGIVLLIATIYHSNNSEYADNTAVEPQISRRRRAIKPATIHYCKFNQYYDQEEGRCLGVPGGGKVLHIENGQSCGINVLKPHCKSSLYYHICKRDKSILAQCANRQIFDNRLQRCIYYDSSKLTPSIIPPDDYTYYDHVRMPRCTRYGRFPVPGHCSMFYTCDTNGHRLHQSVFKCPQNTGYQVDKGVCNIVADCVNDNSVDTTVCVPDAPGENVESSHLDEAVDEKEISEILEGSKASTDDPIVEKEENVNFKNFDDIITTTPVNIIGPLSENNYNDNDNDTEVSNNNASSLNPIKEDLISEGSDEKIMYSQTPNQLETMQKASDEGQNEEDESSLLNLRITSPLTTELDDTPHSITEQYRNNEDSTVMPSNFNDDSVDLYSTSTSNTQEPTPISDISPNINEKMQDAATEEYKNKEDSIVSSPNLNTDSVDLYSASTISNVPESISNRDVSLNADEKMQDAITEQNRSNEDSTMTPSIFNTHSVDSTPTISNVPESSPISDMLPNIGEKMQDVITEQYKNNENSTLTPSNFNTDSVDQYSAPTISNVQESTPISDVLSNINEKMQDAATEQYKSNEDSIVPPSNLNSDSVDLYSAPTMSNIPESSPISDVSPNVDEEMQDEATEQYRNNEDSIVTPSNFDTDSIDSASIINNVTASSPISDVSPNIDEEIQDAIPKQYRNNEDSTMTPSNFNTDSVDQYTPLIVSNVAESSPISDVSPNIDEEIQDAIPKQYRNNEDSTMTPSNFNTDSVDQYTPLIVSNVAESSPISDVSPNIDEEIQDAIPKQYRNNEDSTMTPSNFNTDSVDQYTPLIVSNVAESSPISDVSPNIDEEIQDAIPKQYRNNEDSTMTPSNFNTDSVDQYTPLIVSNVAESSPISDVSPNIDEEIQDAIPKQYRNNEDSTMTPSNFNTDSIDKYPAQTISNVPESSPISDVLPNVDEKMQDGITEEYRGNEDSIITPSTLNTDTVDQYLASTTVSNTAESSPIGSTSSKIDEEMQDAGTEQSKNNEDSTLMPSNWNSDLVDLYSAPTINNISESFPISDVSPNLDEKMKDAITEEYKNNEDSIVTPSNFNTDSVDKYSAPTVTDVSESPISDVPSNIDEKMQDAITEEYRNNEDSIITPPNLNTDSVDQYPVSTINNGAESSPINSMSPKIDEEMQDAATGQDRNNEDSTSNFNTDSITDSPRYDSDILSSPSTLAMLPPQAAVDQIATEGLSEATPSIDSKTVDTSSFTPDGVESFSARYLPDNTELYLTPTTESTFLKEVTDDIATTIHSIQEPSISDTDLVMQSSKDSTETSPTFVTE